MVWIVPRAMATKTSTKSLLKKALALPAEERAVFAQELLVSIHASPTLSSEEEDGIRQALRSIEAGRGRSIADVRARVLGSLKR